MTRVDEILSKTESKISSLLGRPVVVKIASMKKLPTSKHKALMELICEEFQLKPGDLQSSTRLGKVVDARTAYAFVAQALLGDSIRQIEFTLNLKPRNVKYYVKRANDFISVNDPLKTRIEKVMKKYHQKSL